MRLRIRHAFWVLVVGAALAVIPAVASSAGSDEATISGLSSDMWSPMEVAITPGGTVTFQDTTSVPHGVVWTNVPETPKCTGVPIDEGRANWTGSCTLSQEGVYEYYCYVHGMVMSGKIFVNAAGTTTTTTTTTKTSTTQTTSTTSTATKTSSSSTTSSTSSSSTQTSTSPSSTSTSSTQTTNVPLSTTSQTTSVSATGAGAGPQGKAGKGQAAHDSLSGSSLKLSKGQHGTSVSGSVEVAEAGSRLEVELFARGASIAGSHASRVLVGRLVKSKLSVGRSTFKVALNGKAKQSLARHRHLQLSVKVLLAPSHGKGQARTLSVTLR